MKTVYLLGAGFSADLGLPVMSDFRQRARELQAQNRGDFTEANGIFQSVLQGNNYHTPTATNIEEVLSILEIKRLAGKPEQDKTVRKYITDVLRASTPPLGDIASGSSLGSFERWWSRLPNLTPELHGKGRVWWDYCSFVAGLQSTVVSLRGNYNEGVKTTNLSFNKGKSVDEYTVITLNYDTVLEQVTDFFNSCSTGNNDFRKILPDDTTEGFVPNKVTRLIKLHGCISRIDSIRTPTWNKVFGREDSMLAWMEATEALENADYLRIIGYSMPSSDSHIGSLLKYTFATNTDLLGVDVFDKYGSTLDNYKQQFKNNISNWHLYKLSARSYLQLIWEQQVSLFDASLQDGDLDARSRFEFKFLHTAHENLKATLTRE